MIHSMTGYAAASLDIGRAILHLELKSVNSRFLDLSFRIVDDLRALEPQLRELIAARTQRGKVECRLNLLPAAAGPRSSTLNEALMTQMAQWQDKVRSAFPQAAPLTVAEVLHWPGMMGDDSLPPEALQEQCLGLARRLLDDLIASRVREGAKLEAMLRERVQRMRQLVTEVAPRIPELVREYQEKLTARLREALASVDEDRIRQEITLFANRIDVAEEISRLGAHLDEVSRVLDRGGAAGKRLDFLMQELNREANTLGSKSVSADLTTVAVELKMLIEQMREQVQNIE